MLMQPGTSSNASVKAVAMISGGLDSTLAAQLVLEQEVQVVGLYLSAPWGCCDKTKAMKVAAQLGIEFMVVKMTQEYIDLIRHPKYGYGSSMNPCIDCRIYMFQKAKELMGQVGASFLVTGEVLGQRPMSQMRNSLHLIERQAGLDRLVVRPLSAKALSITIPEEKGILDREKLYGVTGRSRAIQMELAEKFGILDYPNPAGGCLLTDQGFGRRVKDLFEHQEDVDLEDMELLRIGRHFRVDPLVKLIVGRNEQENATLEEYLAPGRLLFSPKDFPGPSVLYVGSPSEEAKRLALQLMAHYTRTDKIPPEAKVICRLGIPRGEELNGVFSADEILQGPLEEAHPLGEPLEEGRLEQLRI